MFFNSIVDKNQIVESKSEWNFKDQQPFDLVPNNNFRTINETLLLSIYLTA